MIPALPERLSSLTSSILRGRRGSQRGANEGEEERKRGCGRVYVCKSVRGDGN
jgi:hypothetical protein